MPKRVDRRPTLADVAALSGMSKASVSMILNDRPGSRLSVDAARRVKAAAEELGYRPNPAAQSLRLGKTKTLGFISDQITVTRYASEMIRGLLSAAKEHGHTVLIAETEGDDATIADEIQAMIDRRVDGILIGLLGARMIEVPETPADVPVVIVNGTSTTGHPSVLPDERVAGHAMARLLTDAGHRSVGVIGNNPRAVSSPVYSVTIGSRFDGIRAAFAEAGVDPLIIEVPEWNPDIGYTRTLQMLDAHPDLTAILAGNDGVAFGTYQAIAERGLRVPDDISVASFDDEELASFQRPGLTTARLPYDVMGRTAVEMLLGERPLDAVLIPMPVIERASIRRVS